MSTTKLLSRSLLALLLASSQACFVVDDAALDELVVVEPVDAGTLETADVCGGPGYTVTSNGDYLIDTIGASNDLNTSLCGVIDSSPGPDVFLGIDAAEGQYWHFHVAPAPGNTTVVDPVVSVFRADANGTCNTASCTFVSNRCSGTEEHFGLEFPSSPAGSKWVLAIDNAQQTEGTFRVAVYRPICGNGTVEHGEGCDTADPTSGACDSKCRRIVGDGGRELEPNDDRFWSTRVDVTVGGTATIADNSTVDGVCDSDVYVLSVPAGRTFTARTMMQGTSTCRQYSEVSQSLAMRATTATGSAVPGAGFGMDGSGCGVVSGTVAQDAEIFITLEGAPGSTGPQLYAVQFSIQ